MGYMTPIMILNDVVDQVKNNKVQVINNIVEGMSTRKVPFNEFPIGNHANPMQILRPQHADIPRLVMFHHNLMMDLGRNNSVKNLEYRKQVLELAKQIIKEEEHAIKKLESE